MKNLFILLITSLVFIAYALEPQNGDILRDKMTFEGWKEQIKLNIEPIESDAHDAYIDLYVNELAKEAYEKRFPHFPVGSLVLKPLFSDKKGTEFAKLVVMLKMSPGYDTDNGDWWYGVYDESGTKSKHKGRIQSCIVCHALAKETDYMFSDSLMEEIEVQKGLRKAEVYFE